MAQISFVEETREKSHQKPRRSNRALTDVVAENLDQLGNLTASSVDVAYICEELKKRAQAVAAPVQPPNWSNPPLLGGAGTRSSATVNGRSPGCQRPCGHAREFGKLEALIGSLRSEVVQLHFDAFQDL